MLQARTVTLHEAGKQIIIPAMSDLEQELRRRVEGDVRFDRYSRLLYSTDASMYQMEPMGVVIPRHAGDVQAVDRGREPAGRAAPAPRRRHLADRPDRQPRRRARLLPPHGRVLEVNREELWARVQPGLVQDELNHHVRPMGLLFGPDTSTSNRATIGGMLGNNSGGSHSIAYGLTVEHVIEMTTILADGSRAVFGEVTPEQFEAKMRLPGLEGQIYREIDRIRTRYDAEIRTQYPRHWRRVCGYNLDELVKDRPLNMARLIVGSEGTFLTVVEAKMRLVKKPEGHRGRRDPLPRHAGGARVLAGHSRDGAVRGRAHRQDDPRPGPHQHRAGRAAWASCRAIPPPS